jgi:hypothetical protein
MHVFEDTDFSASWKEMKSRRTMSTFTYQAQEYLGAMGRWMTSRAFLITDRGLVGLGPASMRKGDVVCVLRGGEVPFILRPLEGEYYEFVGECYVHGIMDGSFAQNARHENVETFYLK